MCKELEPSQSIAELFKKCGFKESKTNQSELVLELNPEKAKQIFSKIWLLYDDDSELKIRLIENGEDTYLPKYEFSGNSFSGIILNDEEQVKDYLKKLSLL
jgi:hypothetical protein